MTMATLLALLGLLFATAGLVLCFSGLRALWRARPWGFAARIASGALMLALGTLVTTAGLGLGGYRLLAHEALAARIVVEPLGKQRFAAVFEFPDGQSRRFELAGDEIYVDAHILKTTPLAHILGLHTLWELDRVAGRYRDVDEERRSQRTVHALAADNPVDLFALRRRFAGLAPFIDAEYGSASFAPAHETAAFELRVSNSGLLIRRLPGPAAMVSELSVRSSPRR